MSDLPSPGIRADYFMLSNALVAQNKASRIFRQIQGRRNEALLSTVLDFAGGRAGETLALVN